MERTAKRIHFDVVFTGERISTMPLDAVAEQHGGLEPNAAFLSVGRAGVAGFPHSRPIMDDQFMFQGEHGFVDDGVAVRRLL
jgi:hypothetical protein